MNDLEELAASGAERDELIASAVTLAQTAVRVSQERSADAVFKVLCAAGEGLPGIVMGWVALIETPSLKVIPAASWGAENGYLQAIQVTADESSTGRGPVGTALRTGRIAVLNSIDDPTLASWRDQALVRGYRSVAALPLKKPDGTLVGALALYSDRDGFFTPMRQTMFSVFAEVSSVALENCLQSDILAAHAADLEATILRRTAEIARRNEEFATANAQLAEASRFKSEFLSHMSHELRSPLTAILGFAEVLKDELYGPLNDRQKEHLGHIWQSGRQLLDVIDDVVELTRVESGRTVLDVQECFPRQILEAAAAQLGQVATTSRVQVEWSVHPDAERPIRADARKLKQALFNLGIQATRSSGAGGRVFMSAGVRDENIVIRIGWSRPGSTHLPSDAASRRAPGFGVSLAHRLIELHGGRIEFKSTPDGGTNTVELPYGPASAA